MRNWIRNVGTRLDAKRKVSNLDSKRFESRLDTLVLKVRYFSTCLYGSCILVQDSNPDASNPDANRIQTGFEPLSQQLLLATRVSHSARRFESRRKPDRNWIRNWIRVSNADAPMPRWVSHSAASCVATGYSLCHSSRATQPAAAASCSLSYGSRATRV
jgi:hypothetical protein